MNCPHCHRLLYSRLHTKCGHCGGALPPECLLPEDEVEKVRAEQEQIERRRVADKEKEEAEREREAERKWQASGYFGGGF